MLRRTGATARWTPGTLNPADAFTKDGALGADLLRSMIRKASYSLANEDDVMRQRAEERELRAKIAKERAGAKPPDAPEETAAELDQMVLEPEHEDELVNDEYHGLGAMEEVPELDTEAQVLYGFPEASRDWIARLHAVEIAEGND